MTADCPECGSVIRHHESKVVLDQAECEGGGGTYLAMFCDKGCADVYHQKLQLSKAERVTAPFKCWLEPWDRARNVYRETEVKGTLEYRGGKAHVNVDDSDNEFCAWAEEMIASQICDHLTPAPCGLNHPTITFLQFLRAAEEWAGGDLDWREEK